MELSDWATFSLGATDRGAGLKFTIYYGDKELPVMQVMAYPRSLRSVYYTGGK